MNALSIHREGQNSSVSRMIGGAPPKTIICGLLFSVFWLATAFDLRAADYFVDPGYEGQSQGTRSEPFRSIKQALGSGRVKDGDNVILASGNYGHLKIVGKRNKDFVTMRAGKDQVPKFHKITVYDSANWRFKGLHVSPAYGSSHYLSAMVTISKGSSEIVFENGVLRSSDDVTAWAKADWLKKAAKGIAAGGKNIVLKNNKIENVKYGITVDVDHGTIEGNLINNFSGDGIRGLGDYTVYRNNTIKNCFRVDGHHDDGFQSWSVGKDGVGTGEVVGGILSGNRIIHREDPNQKFPCTLQGIGMFDGTFVDWVIENNVVVTNHWHGISVYGSKNLRILHNTVFNPDKTGKTAGKTWIYAAAHKDGTPPKNAYVLNNIAPRILKAKQSDVVVAGNISDQSSYALFQDSDTLDFSLKPSSLAINAGVTAAYLARITTRPMPELPETDIDGNKRPQGNGFDVGAYEATNASQERHGYLPPD